MASAGDRTSVDVDGVRTTRTRGVLPTVIVAATAASVVALVVLVVARLLSPPPPPPASRPPTPAAQPPVPAGSAASEAKHPTAVDLGPDATIPKTRAGKLRALRALGATPIMRPDGKTDYSAKEVIEALRAAGRHDGIAAFEPPGTVPIKLGLIVPDDFELPEGYIRYIQTTDDGRRLPPILMFHPDYRFVDESGQPVALPADGVVPPELAPPGMPLRPLEVPSPDAAPDGAGRRR